MVLLLSHGCFVVLGGDADSTNLAGDGGDELIKALLFPFLCLFLFLFIVRNESLKCSLSP